MIKSNNPILILYLLFGLFSCEKYEPQFEGAYEDNFDEAGFKPPLQLVYTSGGFVYAADKFGQNVEILNDSGKAELVSINDTHTKIIFKEEGENIEVYDVDAGEVEREISGTSDAIWFDYHSNNQTIYFLSDDGKLDTDGPEILPNRPVNVGSLIAFMDAKSVVVLPNGEVIVSLYRVNDISKGVLVLAEGTTIKEDINIGSSLHSLRLANSGLTVRGGGYNNGRVYDFRTVNLSPIDDYIHYVLGCNGDYFITSDNEIDLPTGGTLDDVAAPITSIDF